MIETHIPQVHVPLSLRQSCIRSIEMGELEYKITFSVYSKNNQELLEVILPRMIHLLDEFPCNYEIGQLLGREIPETQTKLGVE